MNLGLSALMLAKTQNALSPIFNAPLTSTLVPSAAVGSATPAFSRATGAYLQDHEAVQRQVSSGEARFWGARRVQNLCNNTENFAHANWQAGFSGTGISCAKTPNFGVAPDGTTTACRVQMDRGAGTTGGDYCNLLQPNVQTGPVGAKYLNSIWIRSNTGANQNLYIDNWAGSQTAIVATPAWQRVVTNGVVNSSSPAHFVLWTAGGGTADRVIDVLIWHPQCEYVVGQSVYTPSEYLSVGVLSAPYQGAGIDGVQYFETVRLHTQNLLQHSENFSAAASYWGPVGATASGGTLTAPDGSATAYRITDDTSNIQHRTFSPPLTPPAGTATFAASVYLKAETMTAVELWLTDNTFAARYAATINLLTGVATDNSGAWTAFNTITSENAGNGWWRVTVKGTWQGAINGGVLWFGLYHNNCDSAAYVGTGQSFLAWGAQLRLGTPSYLNTYVRTSGAAVSSTDTGATAPIPATTLLGYLSENAATNLQANGNDFNAAGWTRNAPTVATDTGPDGVANQNLKITNGGGGTDSIITTTGWAATANTDYIASVYFKTGGTAPFLRVMLTDGGANFIQAFWNTATGAQGNGNTGGDGTLTNRRQTGLGNGWWRVELTGKTTAARTMKLLLAGVNADNAATTTNGQTVTVWGAQAELATPGAASTFVVPGTSRNPDLLTYPAAGNLSGTLGSVYGEVVPIISGAGAPGGFYTPLVDANTFELACVYNNGTTAFSNDGSSNVGPSGGPPFAAGAAKKVACAWGGGTRSMALTGTTISAAQAFDGDFNVNAVFRLGANGSASAYDSIGCLRNLRFYAQKLTDIQLAAMVA
jgi:hypothetical protein